MRPCPFSIEITIDTDGVLSVRVLGKNWDHSSQAQALLQRLSPFIRKLDAIARNSQDASESPLSGGVQ